VLIQSSKYANVDAMIENIYGTPLPHHTHPYEKLQKSDTFLSPPCICNIWMGPFLTNFIHGEMN